MLPSYENKAKLSGFEPNVSDAVIAAGILVGLGESRGALHDRKVLEDQLRAIQGTREAGLLFKLLVDTLNKDGGPARHQLPALVKVATCLGVPADVLKRDHGIDPLL